jgi:signal transduction histidine kinase
VEAGVRKSSLALAILVEVLALFIFENMRALLTTLERNETASIVASGELQAELHVLRVRHAPPLPGMETYFDRIQALPGPESGSRVVAAGGEQRLEIRRPLGADGGLLFQKTIHSRQLDSFRALKKMLTGLIIFLGIFIAVSGIYLVVRLRRKGPETGMGAGAPLQDYLVDLRKAQMELQDLVVSQKRSSSEKEELNKSIINTIHLGVIYVSPAGKIEIFNPAAQELFGRSYAAARNRPLEEALPGHPELARFILGSGARRSAEIESGPYIFHVDAIPVGGDAKGRLALVRDVSAERARERIERQNANLIMLGEMAASLAHEVRNSLGVILGYSKAMRSEPAKARKIAGEIQFLSEMMESFLRFARPVEKVSRRKTDLGRLVAAAAAAQELAVELPAEPMELRSDPLLLSVVLANLLLNARQSGAGRVKAEFTGGETPALTLGDDGPGIPAADREKIWLPFFSTRDKGTGMGLATVKKLVGALGGDIQLLNPGEKGARFRITFYS